MLLGFEHVGLSCGNIEKSVEFYRDFLGMKVLQDQSRPEGGRCVILDAGGGGLELIGDPQITDTPAKPLPPAAAGVRHFSFAVGDMQKVVGFLKSKGVEFTVEPRPPKIMKNCTSISFCKDPDGNLVEFIGRPVNGN